jgi:toxin ParE1/3/4
MKLEWSADALADLNRFAEFLAEKHPDLARTVAQEIVTKTEILAEHPMIGRPLGGRLDYRELVLEVAGAAYVFQYRYDGSRLAMLRVFHGRETR